MPYTPLEIAEFGGLRLEVDPQEAGAGAAVDATNTDLSQPGRVRSRWGDEAFTTGAAAEAYHTFVPFTLEDGTRYMVAGRPSKIEVLNSSGAVAFSQTISTISGYDGHRFARYGSPTSQRVYIAVGYDSLRYVDSAGSFGTAGGSPPNAANVAVQPVENRLVLANISGATSRVQFSDAGNPDVWDSANVLELTPGDGEAIRGLVAWRDLLFAFKQTKFFVFYGNSVGPTGGSIFQYRTVAAGEGVWSGNAVAVGRDGVYFVNDHGVFLTTGGPPTKISGSIDPVFTGKTSALWSHGTLTSSVQAGAHCCSVINDELYVSLSTSAGRRVFVNQNGKWSVWDLAAKYLNGFSTGGVTDVYFAPSSGSNHVRRLASTATAPTANYRTGFFQVAGPGTEAVVREWLIDGFGTVNVKTAVNDTATLGSAQSVSLGTSPAIAQGRDRRSVRGRNVSLDLSTNTGAWAVSRVVGNVRDARSAGLKST